MISSHSLLWANAQMFTYGILFTLCIAEVDGSLSKQMTLNVDLDLSQVNSDICYRC